MLSDESVFIYDDLLRDLDAALFISFQVFQLLLPANKDACDVESLVNTAEL